MEGSHQPGQEEGSDPGGEVVRRRVLTLGGGKVSQEEGTDPGGGGAVSQEEGTDPRGGG